MKKFIFMSAALLVVGLTVTACSENKPGRRNVQQFECGHCHKSFEGSLANRRGDSRNEVSYFFCNKCSSPIAVQYSSEPFSAFSPVIYGGKYAWQDVERALTNNFKLCSCGGSFEKAEESKCPHCGHVPFETKEGYRLLAGKPRYGTQLMKTPVDKELTAMLMSVLLEEKNTHDHEIYMADLSVRHGVCKTLAAFWNKPVTDMPPSPADVLMQKNLELESGRAEEYARLKKKYPRFDRAEEMLADPDVVKLMAEANEVSRWWIENRSSYEKPWEEAVLKEIETWKKWWNEQA